MLFCRFSCKQNANLFCKNTYCIIYNLRLSYSCISLGLLGFTIGGGSRYLHLILIIRTSFLCPCVFCYFVIFFFFTAVLHDLTVIPNTRALSEFYIPVHSYLLIKARICHCREYKFSKSHEKFENNKFQDAVAM